MSSSTVWSYAEAKEVLVKFFLLDVADLDAAVGWAARMPAGPARQGRGPPGRAAASPGGRCEPL